MAGRRAKRATGSVKLTPADAFDLIRWLARSQSDPRKAVAELVQCDRCESTNDRPRAQAAWEARRADRARRTSARRRYDIWRRIEKVRVEQARTLLTTTKLAAKSIAARCGFSSAPRMARAFERAFGVAPHSYRTTFAKAEPAAARASATSDHRS